VSTVGWTENQYKGHRSTDHTLYVGQTPNGFYRVWVGDALQRPIFTSASEAKAHAETLDRPAPQITTMTLVVTGADADTVIRMLADRGLTAELVDGQAARRHDRREPQIHCRTIYSI
jgi:hypothetical protein